MDDLTLTVGKYKGKTFLWVYDHDETYCDWVANLDFATNGSLIAFQHYIGVKDYSKLVRKVSS